ncbi:MAG: Cna B-type domain-containing protein, partial [Clostridia bacterium]|nr:Cna B-type domain-containing protein [Clostridia bacterium]
TANKKWECPQNEWQEVTVQLLANGKLATTIISGVVPEVTLNNANAWTHIWTNLPVYVNGEKIVWSIKEIKIGNEKLKADGTFVNWIASYDLPIYSTDENGKESVTLGVTNTTKRVMLRLTKTDLSKTKTLAGASFLLEVVDNNGNLLPNEVVKTATTGENGALIFDNLKSAVRYRLSETTAPDGYIKIAEYIYFTINEDGSVSVEDNYYAEAGGNAYNIVVRNAEAVPLPSSGGIGNCMFYAFGLILMITAGIYISILHKRRCSY